MPVSHFNATFGVEIECYMPEGATGQQACAAVSQRIGKPVHAMGYTHARVDHWKAVSDGSLGSYDRGIEFVSPAMPASEEALTEIEKVIKALADFGCTVSKKCGLHVHVGVRHARETGESIPLAFMKRLVNIYAGFEPVIDSLVPPSRRANINVYSRSMTSSSPSAVNAATTFELLARAVAGSAMASSQYGRYFKLNIHAYNKYRTVEFRQHSGTMDSSKARYWILTCLRMVAAARNGRTIQTGQPQQATTAPALVNRARPNSKSWQVGQMMLRPEGVTGSEACAAVGWPSISMPQQATICGLAFTTTRVGRAVRYFARTAQAENVAATEAAHSATPPTPINLLGFLDLIEADADERQYLLQRQADLGGPISWEA